MWLFSSLFKRTLGGSGTLRMRMMTTMNCFYEWMNDREWHMKSPSIVPYYKQFHLCTSKLIFYKVKCTCTQKICLCYKEKTLKRTQSTFMVMNESNILRSWHFPLGLFSNQLHFTFDWKVYLMQINILLKKHMLS